MSKAKVIQLQSHPNFDLERFERWQREVNRDKIKPSRGARVTQVLTMQGLQLVADTVSYCQSRFVQSINMLVEIIEALS